MYAILLNELQPLELERTARILAKAGDLLYADATRAVRSCTGILAKNLQCDEATRIADELNAIGVGCFTMAMDEMVVPPDARPINGVALAPNLFGPMDLYGRVSPVPWEHVVLLSLGHISEQQRERFLLGAEGFGDTAVAGYGMGGAIRRAMQDPPKSEVRQSAMYVLDVFGRTPAEGHWRIAHNGFNYACIGPAITERSDENFRLLVNELVRYATSCFSNNGLIAYMNNEPQRSYTYGDMRQFDEENLWLLQKVYLNLRAQ
ncbi:MAG: hypothetical protein JW889_00750 [Verrucomicrobia bacterium]|nr:hypothetical protein [Verrucomicrobiota bacterium]